MYCWKCAESHESHAQSEIVDFKSEIVDVFKWQCECGVKNVRREFHSVNGLLVLGGTRLVGELNRAHVWDVISGYDFDWLVTIGSRGAAQQAMDYAVMTGKKGLVSWPYKRDGDWRFEVDDTLMPQEVAHPEFSNPKNPIYGSYGKESDFQAPIKKTVIELADTVGQIVVFKHDLPSEDIMYDVLRGRYKFDLVDVKQVKPELDISRKRLVEVPY